jgi:enediyne biosynthesis protein E4
MRFLFATGAVLIGSVAACANATVDPAAQIRAPACFDPPRGPAASWFREVTSESGAAFTYASPDFKGGGLAIGDLDGDGLKEIVAASRVGGLALFRNLGELRFRDDTKQAGLDPALDARALAIVDLDGDRDSDLVLAADGVVRVFPNRGEGTFDRAIPIEVGSSEHVHPVDLDGDGRLDLFVSSWDRTSADRTKNHVLMNHGGLRFTASTAIGAALSWTASSFDFDRDGDQDLYVANDTLIPDFGEKPRRDSALEPDQLLRNDGLGQDGAIRFTDLAIELGLDEERSSMGGLVADFDRDGILDLYVPNYGQNRLFLRGKSGGLEERDLGLGGTQRTNDRCDPSVHDELCLVLSWGSVQSDFDLDGHPELLVGNGVTSEHMPAPPPLLFSESDGAYRELSPEMGCPDARGVIASDLDRDGDQDLVVSQASGPLLVYENRLVPKRGTWLEVELRGRRSNARGLGAEVKLRLASGRVLIQPIGAGGIAHSSSPPEAHFGLGSDEVDSLEVFWPSGLRSVVHRPKSGRLVLEEPADLP